MKSTKICESKSCDALEKIATIGDDEAMDNKSDRKNNPKIRFVQCVDNAQNYHTPVSFKMNKFMMCFKSEPDLSRVQNSIDEPMLNRGRFIAKKLLSGVSMINLRRPFVNSSEKATITLKSTSSDEKGSNKIECESTVALEVPKCAVEALTVPSIEEPAITVDEKIDDDDEDFVDDEEVDREYDDSVDKENRSPIQCNTIEFISKLKPSATAISCGVDLSDSIANDSVSPITKSTHRMSKAMQVKINTNHLHQGSNLTTLFHFLIALKTKIKKGIDNDTTITETGHFRWNARFGHG